MIDQNPSTQALRVHSHLVFDVRFAFGLLFGEHLAGGGRGGREQRGKVTTNRAAPSPRGDLVTCTQMTYGIGLKCYKCDGITAAPPIRFLLSCSCPSNSEWELPAGEASGANCHSVTHEGRFTESGAAVHIIQSAFRF